MNATSNHKPFRILIVDDHVLFRDGLRALLSSVPDAELVGEATNGREAIVLAGQLQPDIILMDIKMPEMNGDEATREIVRLYPRTRILAVSMYDDDPWIFAVMRAGAHGYILKGADHEEMLHAIHAVGRGQIIFSAALAQKVVQFFSSIPPQDASQSQSELSDREQEILHLIAQGYKNAAIAAKLSLSPKTVTNHITNIFSKLHVANRIQAINQLKNKRPL
jgi:DNA-binding NarL/FixJ family response regulator